MAESTAPPSQHPRVSGPSLSRDSFIHNNNNNYYYYYRVFSLIESVICF